MSKKKKMIVTGIMVLGLLNTPKASTIQAATLPETVECNTENMASIKSVYSGLVTANLSISKSGKAEVKTIIAGKMVKTTKIRATITLQKYNNSTKSWASTKSWTETKKGHTLSAEKSYQSNKRGKYRIRVLSTLWNGDRSEKGTTYSTSAYY